MSYMIAFRDADEKDEAMEKLHEAKRALMEVCKMMEDADDDTSMSERGMYRGGGYRERRGRYRDHGQTGDSRYDY